MRVIEKLPADSDGTLNSKAVDDLLVTVHCEMQRISEGFSTAAACRNCLDRSWKQCGPGVQTPGCVWSDVLDAAPALSCAGWPPTTPCPTTSVIGADYNAALIEEARRLASIEDLRCRFVVATRFSLISQPRFTSRREFFITSAEPISTICSPICAARHLRASFNFHQTAIAPFGSWLFHEVRMRQPLAWYDGILSAVRAYRADELLAAARAAVPSFHSAVYGIRLWGWPIPRAFHSLIGIRPEYRETFLEKLGSKVNSLGVLE